METVSGILDGFIPNTTDKLYHRPFKGRALSKRSSLQGVANTFGRSKSRVHGNHGFRKMPISVASDAVPLFQGTRPDVDHMSYLPRWYHRNWAHPSWTEKKLQISHSMFLCVMACISCTFGASPRRKSKPIVGAPTPTSPGTMTDGPIQSSLRSRWSPGFWAPIGADVLSTIRYPLLC